MDLNCYPSSPTTTNTTVHIQPPYPAEPSSQHHVGYPPPQIGFSHPPQMGFVQPVSTQPQIGFVQPQSPHQEHRVVVHGNSPQNYDHREDSRSKHGSGERGFRSYCPDTSDWPWWKWVLLVIALILFGPVVLAAVVVCFFIWVSAKYGGEEGDE